jgi:hypothetical protein
MPMFYGILVGVWLELGRFVGVSGVLEQSFQSIP